jgi:vitamin B12 transporter
VADDTSYVTANIAITYGITNEFTIYGRGSNLFDEQYQNPDGFLHPGRGLFAGVNAEI